MTVSPQIFSEQTELNRRLGFTESLSIVIGRIIGSGIFRTPGLIMAAVAGSVGLFYGAWLVGGLATILGALCYAELVAMMPRSGGPYAYLRAAYSPLWAFLRGWAMFFVSETAAIVVVALVFTEYTVVVLQGVTGFSPGRELKIVLTAAVIWMLTAANLFGVRLSGMVQNIFGLLKVLALLAIIGFCFAAPGGDFVRLVPDFSLGWSDSILALGAALQYSFFAYSGWEGATYVAEEVRNPRRNLPLSILLGILGVMVLYFLVNGAYLYRLDGAAFIAAERSIASRAMMTATGSAGGIMIAGAVMLSTFGNVSTQILAKSRTWHSMARDGLFPRFLGEIHPRYKTPNRSLLAQAVWATLILIFAAFSDNAYRAVIKFFSFTSAIFNVSTFLAVWIMRRRHPDVRRPFRVPLLGVTLGVVLLIQLVFMLIVLYEQPFHSLAGVLLTLTGLVYYYRDRLFVSWRGTD